VLISNFVELILTAIMGANKITLLILLLLSFSNIRAQKKHQSYDQLISDVSKVYDETLKQFILTPESKVKVKQTAINNFKRKYNEKAFKGNIRLTDSYFTDPIKESVSLYNDSTKYKWYLLKESQWIQYFSKEVAKQGYKGEAVDNWCNCVVSKFMTKYPNADFNMTDDAVAVFSYNTSKECGRIHLDVKKMENSNIRWNDSSRSAITKVILNNHEKNLSGIYSYNQLISLTQWQVKALEKKFPQGLKMHEIRSEEVVKNIQEEYEKWKSNQNTHEK